MFIPAFRTAAVFTSDTQATITGDRVYTPVAFKIGWSPLYLRNDIASTAVRADSSASKSRADINAGEFRIVLDKTCTQIKSGDIILLPPLQTFNDDSRYKITRLLPRHDIFGRLHHFEIDLEKSREPIDVAPYAVKNVVGKIVNFKAAV